LSPRPVGACAKQGLGTISQSELQGANTVDSGREKPFSVRKQPINLAPVFLFLSFSPSCLLLAIGLDLHVGLPLKMARERGVLSWEALGCAKT